MRALLLFLVSVWCCDSWEHLVVLVHGFQGRPTDLGYLNRRLESETGVRVLCASANDGRTFDGVAAGGKRIAREIEAFVVREKQARSISFVGNSLGGLYARYALGELYDATEGSVAGLRPAAFATTAAPHLGVREAPYGFALSPVAALGAMFLSDRMSLTARDLCGQTDVLDLLAFEPRFLRPLGAFRSRKALASLRKDFMVPFKSALFTSLSPSAFKSRASGGDNLIYCLEDSSPGNTKAADSIAALGWSRCAADLREPLSPLSVLPLAHNKLVALERTGLKAFASPFEQTKVGRPVMNFLADWIIEVIRQNTPKEEEATATKKTPLATCDEDGQTS